MLTTVVTRAGTRRVGCSRSVACLSTETHLKRYQRIQSYTRWSMRVRSSDARVKRGPRMVEVRGSWSWAFWESGQDGEDTSRDDGGYYSYLSDGEEQRQEWKEGRLLGGDENESERMNMAKRMEDTQSYVSNVLFGGSGSSSWRGHGKRRYEQCGGVLSSSVNPGLSDVVTRLDTRDAMEACQGLAGDEKEECFVVFGVDRDADAWYDIVGKFDALLALDTDPLEESVHRGQERV